MSASLWERANKGITFDQRIRRDGTGNVRFEGVSIGFIKQERLMHRGHGCWRWVAYRYAKNSVSSDTAMVVPDSAAPDKLTAARALAFAYMAGGERS